MKKIKRILAVLVTGALVAGMLTGCSSKSSGVDESLTFSEESSEASKAESSSEASEVSAASESSAAAESSAPAAEADKPTPEGSGTLNEVSANTIGSLNPQTYINSYASTQIRRLSPILYDYFVNDTGDGIVLQGEVAEEDPIDVNGDGKTWQIKLRQGLTWENGDPINADTVMYTWKEVLDPTLANSRGGNFAKDVIEIAGAEDYYEGKSDWDSVGLKKIDDYTVEIDTVAKQDAQEVMTHLSHPANCLVNEEYYEKGMNADRTETLYGTSADYWISGGPFKIESWQNDEEIHMVKNPNYVFADKIWLAGIDIRVVEDTSTQMQMFENGEVDYIAVPADSMAQYEEDPRLMTSYSNCVRHIVINSADPDQPILGNENFRLALFYGTDRKTLADMNYGIPADYIVPSNHIIDLATNTAFRDTEEGKANTDPVNYSYDPEKAKELFNKALEETGVDSVDLTMIYNDTAAYKAMSEFVQNSWQQLFGEDKFKLELQAMPSSQRGDQVRSWPTNPSAYELSWAGWSSTSLMPWNAFKYWTSFYTAKNEPYINDEFDATFNEACYGDNRFDDGVRLKDVDKMEDMLIQHAIIIPVYEIMDHYLKSDRVELTQDGWMNEVGWGWNFCKIKE